MMLLASIGRPYIPGWDQLAPFVGELWLIASIAAVLLTPFFVRRANLACSVVALAGVVLALMSLLFVSASHDVGSFHRGLLVADDVAFLWKVLLLMFVGGVILLYWSAASTDMHEGDAAEFFTLLLGATLGMSLMASASNLLMIFLAIELASLPSYVLAGFRKTTRMGAEASLKYVLFGAASSSIMVYGMTFLYGMYGTLDLSKLAQQIAMTTAPDTASSALLAVSVVGIIVGIGFKLSAVPLHFWCPDVFEGANVDVSAFLSVASKGAALVLLLRIVMSLANAFEYSASADALVAVAATLGVLGAITATVGNTAAFFQDNVKRLLAYSSIAHAGYMLCGVSLLVRVKPDFDVTTAATQAILLYLAVYLFMNLGAFTVTGLVGRMTGREDLDGFTGLGRRSPLLAGIMVLMLISLIGLPPMGGFAAKVNLLWAMVQNGSWWWVLVAVIGVNTILSAFYYFRIIRAMYLTGMDRGQPVTPNPLGLTLSGACAIVLILMFIRWDPLADMTGRYSRFFLPQSPVTHPVSARTINAAPGVANGSDAAVTVSDKAADPTASQEDR